MLSALTAMKGGRCGSIGHPGQFCCSFYCDSLLCTCLCPRPCPVSPGPEHKLVDLGCLDRPSRVTVPKPAQLPLHQGLGAHSPSTAPPEGQNIRASGNEVPGTMSQVPSEGPCESLMGTRGATPMRIAIYSHSCQNHHQGFTENVGGGGSNTD